MRNYLTLIILVGTLALLGGYWKQARSLAKPPTAKAEEGPEAQRLLQFDPTTVTNLQIHRGRNSPISLTRQAGKEWVLESPFLAQADKYLVDRALIILGLIVVKHTVAQEGSGQLSQFGLNRDNSVMTITVLTENGKHWLELGGVSTNGMMHYARSSDHHEIALIEQKSFKAFPQTANEFIDRRLFPLAQETLHTIELKEAGRSVVLQAGEKGWLLESPVQAHADNQVMTEWLQRLAGLNATAVHPSNSQGDKRSLGPWIGSLRLAAGEVSATVDVHGTPERILIVRSDRPSLQYEMPPDMLNAIFLDAFALRNKHILQGEPTTITSVEFRQDNHSVRVIREKAGWVRNGRLLAQDQAQAIEHWLVELHLSDGGALLRTSTQCRMVPSLRWELRIRDHKSRLLGRTEFARTQTCGDVATLPSGEWIRLQTTGSIDLIQQLSLGQAAPVSR